MNDQATEETLSECVFAADEIPADLKLNWAEIMAAPQPGDPDERIAYDSRDYATEQEADAALEAFFNRIIDAPYEEE